MSHEQGIAWLADTVIAEMRAAGDINQAQFLAAKFKSIDAVFERRGWTANQRRQAFLGLGQAMEARLGATAPSDDGDPMERLATYFSDLALAKPYHERRDILNDAFRRVREEIDQHAHAQTIDRDLLFGRFAFALAARIVEPAGRA